MDAQQIKKHIAALVYPDMPNEWELEEHAEHLARLPDTSLQEILKQVPAIWPVSHSLCFSFLEQAGAALNCLHPEQLPQWVNAMLDAYETSGLHQARKFMADVENNFLCQIRGESGLRFEEVTQRLTPYLHALAGRHLELAASPQISTDTTNVFLPHEVGLFREKEKNFLLYKLAASFQWAFIACGTYYLETTPGDTLITGLQERYKKPLIEKQTWLDTFFNLFPVPELAKELFQTAETARITAFLHSELPGLMQDAIPVRQHLYTLRPDCTTLQGAARIVEGLKQWLLYGKQKGKLAEQDERLFRRAIQILAELGTSSKTYYDTASSTVLLYELMEETEGAYQPTEPLFYQGHLAPKAAHAARLKRREEVKERFIETLAALLPSSLKKEALDTGKEQVEPGKPPSGAEADTALMPLGTSEEEKTIPSSIPIEQDGNMEFITVAEQQIKLPESMKPLLKNMKEDIGHIPGQYISSALDFAGNAIALGASPESREGESLTGSNVYDEWDFRRTGFRKNWCLLYEKELSPVKGTFVENTLERHRGLLIQLRRQFEMMRAQHRFIKRQRDGEDIDLDTLTESLADTKAGLPPSERLFIRLIRSERNICATFLVDMSSSTEGWVGHVIKESLILMCEALGILGDRYAIYGFSGMRRLRSDLYHIKHMDEPYNEEVKGRIAAISPQEYTRMGPPIRHVTRMLAQTEAKVRLLIIVSDGKPEDYDDYKGDYAIEDTRHALIEAKNLGIHPFCITIDKHAHEYIAHMYGEVNYIFISDIKKLPNRLPEIYRTLTT